MFTNRTPLRLLQEMKSQPTNNSLKALLMRIQIKKKKAKAAMGVLQVKLQEVKFQQGKEEDPRKQTKRSLNKHNLNNPQRK